MELKQCLRFSWEERGLVLLFSNTSFKEDDKSLSTPLRTSTEILTPTSFSGFFIVFTGSIRVYSLWEYPKKRNISANECTQ